MSEDVKIIDSAAELNTESEAPAEEREVVFEEAVEAMLFAAGHPISYATIARVLDMTPTKVKEKVMDYATVYNNSGVPRGVILLTYADSCQLCTKSEYLYEIRDALGIKKSGTLSTSSLEVLAIVAYNQPVTRAFVDTLRRVDSSYAMNNLLDRGLIVSKGRLDVPGRPMLYGTTSDFLRCFGLNDLSSLPRTSEELAEAFNNAKNGNNSDMGENAIIGAEQISADIESAMPEAKELGDTTDEAKGAAVAVAPDDNALDIAAIDESEAEPSAEDDVIND